MANSKCSLARYGKNTSNSAESMNSMIKKYVTKDITNLIISLNNFNMKIFYERSQKEFNFNVFKKESKNLDSKMALARLFLIQQSSKNIFLVDNVFIVDFRIKKCSCKMTFEFGIPCKHFCAVIILLREDPLSYVESFFCTTNYNASYSEMILPMSVSGLTKDYLRSPVARRYRGRTRIIRIRSEAEN